MHFNYTQKGFGLVEALVACAIFGIAFVGFLSVSSYGTDQTQKLLERNKASLLANMVLEDMLVNQEDMTDSYVEANRQATTKGVQLARDHFSKWENFRTSRMSSTGTDGLTLSVVPFIDPIDNVEKNQVIVEVQSLNGNVNVQVGRVYSRY